METNKFNDLTGKRFGRLLILNKTETLKSNTTRYKCQCDCGKITETTRTSLIKGQSKSCGCLAKQLTSIRSIKHNVWLKREKYYIGITNNTKTKFIINHDDYELVNEHCWFESKNGYITTRIKGTNKLILLHRYVLNFPNSAIDHINRDKKDNRKENLRLVTSSQNSINKSVQKNNKSGVVGVRYDKNRKKWISRLNIEKRHYMKRFDRFEEAVEYRKFLEKKHFKEYSPNDTIN